MLRLIYPDSKSTTHPLAEPLVLGRGPLLDDPYISRSFALIEPLMSSPPSLMITAKGSNSIIVEEKLQKDGPHVVKGLLEKGESMQLQAGDLFYVCGRKESTMMQVIGDSSVHETSDGLPRTSKRRRLDAGPTNPPAPFSLMSINRSEHQAPVGSGDLGVTLSDLCPSSLPNTNVKLRLCILSNYQFDLTFLHQHYCPALFNADHVIILHGGRNGGNDSERMRDECMTLGLDLGRISIHAPPVKDYGTHHSKFILLFYSDREGNGIGLRVIISSSNFIQADLESKTQSIWHQDFPPSETLQNDGFGTDLALYLSRTGLHQIPGLDQSLDISRMVLSHDFSSARGRLIGSVPGWHEGSQWGHLKLRRHLQSLQQSTSNQQEEGRIILQYTSIGRLDAKWLFHEFGLSLSGGSQPSSSNLSSLYRLIWPTFCQVRDSFRGWASGSSIPGSHENISKDFLRPLYSKWDGRQVGRMDVMPHMKSYTKFSPEGRIDWIVTGSHNLSKVAWGMMSKEGKLGLQSFELSVLLHPLLEGHYLCHQHFGFQVVPLEGEALRTFLALKEARTAALALASSPRVEFWPLSRATESAQASGDALKYFPPLPYDNEPEPYLSEDRPWCRETEFEGFDSQGLTWKEVYMPYQ